MKLIKYFMIAVAIIFALIIFLTSIPAVQDSLVGTGIKNQVNSQPDLQDDSLTALVCGSRSPIPAPGRAEACILVNAGGNYYVVDSGDGSVSNLRNWQVDPRKIKASLLTHLHSDHISDLADLHQMTWIGQSRPKSLDVYGPQGVERVTQGFEDAYQLDYGYRHDHHGDSVAPLDVVGFDPHPIDLTNPVIVNEGGLRITAFAVQHEPVEPALGYRFDYKGRSLLISGDTRYSKNLIKYSQDADVLFHEGQANHILKLMEDRANDVGRPMLGTIMKDILTYHTTPEEAAQAANLANVDHLMFYHLIPAPRNELMERMFFRGVNAIRKNWSSAEDGTMVVLPLDSDEIKITKIN